MIETVDTVEYGRPATEALGKAIAAAKRKGPLQPVTVVVESNLAGLSLRRLLGSGQLGGLGLVNVNFATPFRLAELLAPISEPAGQPLTNPVLGAAVRKALRDDPGPLARAVEHPATEAAVAALYAELSHVSPATLQQLESAGGMATASVRLYRSVAARLGEVVGEPELAQAVISRPDLEAQAHRVGDLIWFLPAPGTPSLERLMARLVEIFPTRIIVGVTGNPDADGPVRDLCDRLGITISNDSVVPPHGDIVISAPDPDEEVRAALRWVLGLVEEGVPLDRIGVFFPTPDPYVRSLLQHLDRSDIPANGPVRETLADSVAGRTLLAALDLPAHQWRRDRVMALVASAPVRNGEYPVRPASWEAVSRAAGVLQGVSDWGRKLAARLDHLGERRREILSEEPEALAGKAAGHDAEHLLDKTLNGDESTSRDKATSSDEATSRARRRLLAIEREENDIRELGGFVTTLAEHVQAVDQATTWQAKAEAAQVLLVHLLGPEPRHHSWPEPEQQAAVRVVDALARLSLLDPIEPHPSTAVFTRALSSELEVSLGRHGRYGEGLVFGPLASAPGQDLDAVVVLGMAEGICPARRRDNSLLPDSVRAGFGNGELRSGTQAYNEQHRSLLAALAAAPLGRRLLVHPRGNLRNNHEHLPSRWLLDTISAKAHRRIFSTEFAELPDDLVQHISSHAQGLATSPALTLTDRDLDQLRQVASAGNDISKHPAITTEIARGIDSLRSRLGPEFTIWDGNLAGHDIPSPTRDGALMSATGLEQWATCGFRYFLSHVLDLRDRDDPERIHQIQARDRGGVVHKILERFFDEMIQAGAPDPTTPWTPAQRQRALDIAREELDAIERSGRTGRPVLWRHERQRLLHLVNHALDTDNAERKNRHSTPVRVELPFGLKDAEPVLVSLDDGRSVRFRGFADRVDQTADGRWVVLDYKTGSADRYKALDADPFNEGTTLQLGLYAEAAVQLLGNSEASAYYWMLEHDSDVLKGYSWTPERARRFREVIEAMVDGVDGGVFPLVPGEYDSFRQSYANCRFCDFDRLCPSDRGAYAEAKVAAPQLKVRDRLLPPDPDDTEPTDDPVSNEVIP